MWPSDNWRVEAVAKAGAGRVREETTVEIARAEFLNAYDQLADGIINSPGFGRCASSQSEGGGNPRRA
jgi:hypothetical protein